MAHKDVTLVLVNLSSEVRDVSSDIFVGLDILPSCVDFCLFCTLRGNLCHVFAHDPVIKALSREEMQPAPPTIPEVLCFSLNTIVSPPPRRRKLGERIILQTTQTPH